MNYMPKGWKVVVIFYYINLPRKKSYLIIFKYKTLRNEIFLCQLKFFSWWIFFSLNLPPQNNNLICSTVEERTMQMNGIRRSYYDGCCIKTKIFANFFHYDLSFILKQSTTVYNSAWSTELTALWSVLIVLLHGGHKQYSMLHEYTLIKNKNYG